MQEEDCKLHLQLVLKHLQTGVVEHRQLSFSEAPSLDVKMIKYAVEMKFNIPVFVQTLTYDKVELRDENSLKGLRLRNGDIIHITHLGTAEVLMVNSTLEYLTYLSNKIRDNLTANMLPPSRVAKILDKCTEGAVRRLTEMQVCEIVNSIIESVDSISKDERGFPLTQYITSGRISRGGTLSRILNTTIVFYG